MAVNLGTKLAGKEHLADKISSGVERGVNYGYETEKMSLKVHATELKDIYKPEVDEGVQFAKDKAQQKFDEKFGKKDEEQTGGEGLKKSSKKGSAEMKERMAKLRAMCFKKGGNIWGDMMSGLIHTGIPVHGSVLGGVGGEFLRGPVDILTKPLPPASFVHLRPLLIGRLVQDSALIIKAYKTRHGCDVFDAM